MLLEYFLQNIHHGFYLHLELDFVGKNNGRPGQQDLQ